MAIDSRKGFFDGKSALITGGSSGIGLATARLLVQKGASVWIVARDRAKLEAAVQELKAARKDPVQKVGFSIADIAVEADAARAVREAAAVIGAPDVLVNNAGISEPGYFLEQSPEIFHRIMDVNYFGAVNIVRAAAPAMVARGTGSIVNVSSMVAILSMYGYTAYGASKWALRGFTDILRYELKPLGIRVHLVLPPDVDTPQLAYEEPIKPFETKVIVGNAKVMSPERVAADILGGVERNRYLILTGTESIFYYWLTNLLGPLQYSVMDMFVADAVKKKKKRDESSQRL